MDCRRTRWGFAATVAALTLTGCSVDEQAPASPSSDTAASAEVSEHGFRIELATGDIPLVVQAGGGVAEPGTSVRVDLNENPDRDDLLTEDESLPAVDIRLGEGKQPSKQIRLTYDLSNLPDFREALSAGGTPLVVTESDSAGRGLLPATVSPDGRTLVVESPHQSTFRPAVVDLGGKFSAAWAQQQERRAGAGATADCPEPDGVAIGDTRARAQSAGRHSRKIGRAHV